MPVIFHKNVMYAGGSGGGSSYTETTLWDYRTDNNDVIPYNAITLTLHQSIDDFDALIIENRSLSSDSGNWDATTQFLVNVNMLKNAYNQGRLIYTSFDNRSSSYYISGTTFQKVVNNVANTNGIVKIVGVKY